MAYPWMLTQIANEHERALLEQARRRRLARAARDSTRCRPRWRERLGWRLVDLGIHLVMHPDGRLSAALREDARSRSAFGATT